MTDTSSERRLAENEVVFRQFNEDLQKGIEDTNKLAEEDNQPEFKIDVSPDAKPLRFFCECADEKCIERVLINLHEYSKIHKDRAAFVIKPDHEVLNIEGIVSRHDPEYIVVKKHNVPPEKADGLKPTALNNN